MSNPADHVPSAPPAPARKVCYLSRRRGWIDPASPHRPVSEVNLLAVYQGHAMWTLQTTWAWAFGTMIPREIERAYVNASARVPISEGEVSLLRLVAERLGVELRVVD